MMSCKRLATGTKIKTILNSAMRCQSTVTYTAPKVTVTTSVASKASTQVSDSKILKESCGTSNAEDDLEELEEMFIMGPAGIEWNGPTRGGARPEPTRYKDWERKGRCTDF